MKITHLRWANEIFRAIFQTGSSPRSLESVVDASLKLSKKRWGGLIVIQRESGLRSYKESGVFMKAEVSSALLVSIFNPSSSLHDGAVIMQNTLVESAGVYCLLPKVI